MTKKYQVIVIGGGPGGYVAALRSAQLGMSTCLIEQEHLGGICLNWGCIPTKTLLRSSEINHLLQRADEFGFNIPKSAVSYDLNKIVERSRKVANQLSRGISHLLKKNKVDVVMGKAQFVSSKELEINSKKITGEHIIIATGARAKSLPGFEVDDKIIMTYKQAMVPKSLPKKLLIVGSGAIGVEFASFYHNLGSQVTIVEVKDCILPVEDKEVSQFMQKSLCAQGIKIHTNSTIKSLKKIKDKAEVEISNNSVKEKFDSIIMAVGIQGNIEGLGLDNTNVKTDKNSIITDEWCKTDDSNIYAIGDVAGAPWLAHKASHEGIICVEKIVGLPRVKPLKKNLIPGCTYAMPQVASIGITEQAAKEQNLKVRIGKFPFMANGKAIAIGETEGFVKTIFDQKTGELLGAHMVGAEVTEMIQGYSLAMKLEATEEELMHCVFPHPTLSEAMHESVLSAFDKPLHI